MSRRTPMLLHLISLFVLAIAKDIGGEYLRKRNLLRSGHRVTQAGSETGTRVCYITAIFGDSKYETRLKQIHNQTIQSDWIAFTDLTNLEPNGWDIDRTPYHKLNPSPLDDGTYYNSFSKNSHPFRIAKYYKQAFQNIPRLQKYDVIIWLDATIEIEMDTASEWAVRKIESDKKMIIAFAHEMRRGSLKSEAFVLDTKYHDLNYLGFAQPDQNTIKQYESYIQRGYIDTKVYWDSKRVSANVGVLSNANFGVWITCFVVFDNKNQRVTDFLNVWYTQTLNYTTQDQVGFPFAAQMTNLIPYTLPDAEIWGNKPHSFTQVYWKWDHGKRSLHQAATVEQQVATIEIKSNA